MIEVNKKYIILTVWILITVLGFSQEKYNLKTIILLPENVKIDNQAKENIDFYTKYILSPQRLRIISNEDSLKVEILNNNSLTKLEKDRYINQIEFAKYLNFENSIIQDYSNTLQELTEIDLPNSIILTATEKSTTKLEELIILSEKYHTDLIISVVGLDVSEYKNGLLIKPRFSVYTKSNNSVKIIKPFVEYDNYNKKYITVKERTLNIYSDDIDYLSQLNDLIRKEYEINKLHSILDIRNQKSIFSKNINNGKNNHKIKGILVDNNKLENGKFYSVLVSKNSNEFVAFITGNEKMKSLGHLIIVTGKKKDNSEWDFKYNEKIVLLKEELNDNNIKELLFEKYKSKYFLDNSIDINNEFWNRL
ncbi:hypothetical protein [Lentimicrobium sp. S6]|uniref:hypothetical protein n=1 Tax=Lentimicrobium sp. S6 TaxID=2735872 RepID=UPI0015567D10|nr:hypothetical protein [Lentimicrobium sp. S6]NPD48295.1 hypothetical protein [Lentimicrobium sp. S6]